MPPCHRLGLAVLCALATCGPAAGAARNIVLIVTDDQSPDFGAYGNPVLRTPHLDALAADGLLFRQAFCTTASCSASRSVILTGLHNHANGQYGHEHSIHDFASHDDIISLPVVLGAAGYRTARIGKFHVAPEPVYQFEQVIPAPSRNPVAMADACSELLAADDDRPFFLYFCPADPHRDGRFADEIDARPNRFGNPAPGEPGHAGVDEIAYDAAEVIVQGFLPDSAACRAELAQYYQACSRIDLGIGRLMRVLDESGHRNDTLVMFLSDHGLAMPGAKTTLYEGGLRSPLIVRDPYRKARGAATDAMISFVDLTPTLLDFAGLLDPDTGAIRPSLLPGIAPPALEQRNNAASPGRLHGRSFLTLLDEPEAAGFDVVYASHTFHEIQMYYPMRCVRERRLKLIWNIAHPLPFPFASDLWAAPTWQAQYQLGMDAPYGAKTVGTYSHRPRFELYDVIDDPHEGRNLADDPGHAADLERLKQQLTAFQQRTGDPWISKWDHE